MTSFQSTLADGDDGIAEELAASQREISIAEFFEKNKHMLGFDSGARGLVTAVKEAVDNALDATEEAGILPDIYVEIQESGDYYTLVVEDNGPGITKEQIPKVFGKLLYGSRFHAREQSRGQQGIGISAAVLYSQLTSGTPAKITSRTQGASEANYYELVIDTDTNEPVISEEETTSWDRSHGTRIELEMEANMRARSQLHDYIEHTAVVNPHARLELREPKGQFKFERAEGATLPAETEEIRPHPHGVELGALIKMLGETDSRTIRGFLQEEFTRVGAKTADNICDAFRDRHYGRELAWRPPTQTETDLEAALGEAVANKPAADTEAFADHVADAIRERGELSYTDLETLVADAAEEVGESSGSSFGATVQGHVVDAAWDALTADRRSDLYRHVNAATSNQKDDATVDALAERLAAKFGEETPRDRLTRDDLYDFVARAAETTEDVDDVTVGETARENITEELWTNAHTVTDDLPSASQVASDRNLARELLAAMQAVDVMSPPTSCLAPIEADLIEAGLRKEFDADFYAAATRDADVHGGDPFVVEAGIAYGGDLKAEGKVDVMRFANRVPLVYQRGACATTKVLKQIGWRNYGLDQPGGSGLPNGPCVIMVHVASTNVPFTSESKDALASVPEIEDEIELAVREAARELKSFLNKRRSMQKRREKQNVIMDVLPKMADKVSEMTGREPVDVEDSLARIMNNVLVERERDGESVTLTVENHTSTGADLDVTEIVSDEPADLSAGTVVEMDGEWFVKWSPAVSGGDEATLEYTVAADADCDLSVSGVEEEKLTVNQ
ncbi:DNA topoisomerase VI subunit B [Halarchaeum sp. P4]|uniref:DNA topoisomerase VI subunit B n=1 Tax=Halarchaeum sp. P4 TaxID=3421639 RepID=UPI003EB772BB